MATRHNQCVNPACTNDVTGWTGGSTPARVTGLPTGGGNFPVSTGAHYTTSTFAQTPTGAASPAVAYTGSLYIRETGGLGTSAATLYLAFTRSSGGDDFSNTTSIGAIATGVVTRISFTATAPANTTGVYLLYDGNNFTIRPCDLTAVLLEQASSLDTYFDGNTAGATWDGTAGNSASTLTTGTTHTADSTATTTAALTTSAVKTAEASSGAATTAGLAAAAVKTAEAVVAPATTAALTGTVVLTAEATAALATTAALASVGAVSSARSASLATTAALTAAGSVFTPGDSTTVVGSLITVSRTFPLVTTTGGGQ